MEQTSTTATAPPYKIAEVQISLKGRNRNLPKIITSYEAEKIFREVWNGDTIELLEDFKVLLLNHAQKAIGIYHASTGGITGTVADIRLIMAVALNAGATRLIVAHNHPSGNLTPSEADKRLTQKLKEAAAFFDIQLLDHLILAPEGCLSMADEGLMY